MSHFTYYAALRLLIVAMSGMLVSIAAPSAWAIDGRTAVGICIDSTAGGARCAWSVNDKGEIDICNRSGCVYCPSATSECSVARGRPRPARTLPAGATVKATLGGKDLSIAVSKEPFTGPILRRRCPEGLHVCLNRCIGRNEVCAPPQ